MEAILDFSQPFNTALLDEIISAFYNVRNPQQQKAGQVLYALKEDSRSWAIADKIIENCKDSRSIFFGLILLEEMVQQRWSVIPADQRESVKNYTLSKVMQYSESMESIQNNEDLLHKWDIILVEIFKKEWPQNWTGFVHDLVTSALESESRCRNSIFILKIVVEDVFQFSETTLTSQFSSQIQNALKNDMLEVYQLCTQVLVNTEVPSLLLDTIDIIRLIIKYLPDECVFSYELVDVLLKFITLDAFRTSAMTCLHEILCHPNSGRFPSLVSQSLRRFLEYMKGYINIEMDLKEMWPTLPCELTDFVNELALFLTSVCRQHRAMLEANSEFYVQLCEYVLFLTRCPDREVLKVCMEFWKDWAHSIYDQFKKSANGAVPRNVEQPEGPYTGLTQQVIDITVQRMSRPEEVMVMENEDGEVVRVETKDTDGIALYKTMKECLVMLVSVDYTITEAIFMNYLDIQMQLSAQDPFRGTLQPLIWSIGSISGVLGESDERRLLMTTIMDLLRLVQMKETKDDKAVVAGCLMYVIQQYPRFLKQHFKFLRTVINKNFEFMHEKHPGVQDMACDTFKKIAKNCGSQLVVPQRVDGVENPPFIQDIIMKMVVYMEALSPQQKDVFYEAVASVTKFERNDERRVVLVQNMLFSLNETMRVVIKEGVASSASSANGANGANGGSGANGGNGGNNAAFFTSENLQKMREVLRYNRVVGAVVGNDYTPQLVTYFQDFVDVFTLYSEAVAATVREKGELAAGYQQTRQEVIIKREVLRIMQTFVETYKQRADASGSIVDLKQLCGKFLPVVLRDFSESPDCVKEPATLQFLAVMIEKLKESCREFIPGLLDSVYMQTLSVITVDRLRYSELCLSFFKLMENLSRFAFQFVFDFPEDKQKLLVDSIIWGYMDTERRIYECSLDTMLTIMNSVRACSDAFRQPFYHSFLIYITTHTLCCFTRGLTCSDCLTDKMHIPALGQITALLKVLFSILMSQEVTQPLLPSCASSFQNAVEVCHYLADYLMEKFPTCSPDVVNGYILALSSSVNKTENEFKVISRDFLIQLKEVTNANYDLFADEKERRKREEEAADLERRKQIPGLVSANELPTDFDDLFCVCGRNRRVENVHLVVAAIEGAGLVVGEDAHVLHIDARVLVGAQERDDALLQHVAQVLRRLRNVHYASRAPVSRTVLVVRLQVDQANQALTEEVVLVVQLLVVTLRAHAYALLALRNAVATVPLRDDALHLHHVLLHDVEVVLQLRIRTGVACVSAPPPTPTDVDIIGHILDRLLREVGSEYIDAALVGEGDSARTEGAVEIAEELVLLSHGGERQGKQLDEGGRLLRVFGALG